MHKVQHRNQILLWLIFSFSHSHDIKETIKETQEEFDAKALCVDDEEEKESEIKSDLEALQMAEKHLEYARFKRNEKLSLVLS